MKMKLKQQTIHFLTLMFMLTLAASVRVANASEVCMNTSNGNGGSIAYYPYLFNNNTFGWSNDKNGSSECLTLNYTNGANNGVYYDGFGSTWDWPTNTPTQYDVKAYPSVVYGWQYGYTYSGLGLPAVIYDNTNVPVYMSYSITGSQSEDLIVDNWILSSPNASAQYAEVEIFVTDTFAKQTSGNLGSITLDNTFYYVSSASRGAWEAYSFIPNNNSTSGTASVNVKDFVNALVYDYGVFANSKYLGGAQVGMEIYQGQGGITFNPVAISTN
jgi:hypothetical protein